MSVQVFGLLALHYVWFGAILPCMWKDRGFPAILQLFQVNHLHLNTFEQDLHVPTFALAASLLHTVAVLLGVTIGTFTRALQKTEHTHSKIVSLVVGWLVFLGLFAVVYYFSFHLFQYSFNDNWNMGFQYSKYFFQEQVGGADFGHVTAMSLTIECTTAYLIRVCTRQMNGVLPTFATNAIPMSLVSFGVCFVLFRNILTPHVIKSLAAATGIFSFENIVESGGVHLPNLQLTQWAALAAAVHTLCIALGMTFHAITKDVVSSITSQTCRSQMTKHINGMLRFLVFFVGTTAFFTTIQMWLAYANTHGIEFVERSNLVQGPSFFTKNGGPSALSTSSSSGTPSDASVAVAGGFYTLAFLIGAVLSEGPIGLLKCVPIKKCSQSGSQSGQRCSSTVNACVSRNLRLRPAPAFVSQKTIQHNKRNGLRSDVPALSTTDSSTDSSTDSWNMTEGITEGAGVTEGLLLAGTAVLLALYVADHQLLGVTVVETLETIQSFLMNVPQLGSVLWSYLHSQFSRNQLFFMTLPVLLISEIPLWFFTVLDYMKLKYFDTWRIHYSKIDQKRPRNYPTNQELYKAFKVHCINFFGIYCSVFVVGVGIACQTNIVPYSFAKDLPNYWILEFLFCSLMSDVLFYVLHRAVHSKGLYQRLHKMHHEWIYTIALGK